jgi:endonuclease/exonuclease/phosphatase family metal-dependent hydrolase
MWWRAEGLAILAPWPLDDVWHATLSVDERRRSFRRRVAIGATVRRFAGDALRVFDTHLATDSPLTRLGQARRLTARIAAEAPPAVVVAGDLNARDELELLHAFTAVGVVDAGGDDTSPADAPVQRIDYILVPANAEVLDRRTPAGGPEWSALSDHLPTLVEFTLP